MVDQTILSQATRLDVAERVELINALWASIDADELPVPSTEADLVDQRLAEADVEPLVGRSWESVETALRRRVS